VEGITHVFNMAVPRSAETYVHRVGRTGRAGHFGQAATFVTPRDVRRFRQMLQEAGVKLEVRKVPQPQAVRDYLRQRYLQALGEQKPSEELRTLATDLLQFVAAEDLIPLLLSRDPSARAILEAGQPVAEMQAPPPPRRDRPGRFEEPGRAGPRFRPDARRPFKDDARHEGKRPFKESSPDAPRPVKDDAKRPFKEGKPGKAAAEPLTRRTGHVSHEAEMVRLKLSLGRKDHINVGGVVRLVCNATGLSGENLGVITLEEACCWIDIQEQHARHVRKALNGLSYRGKDVRVTVSALR
jgi:superfamily II DNA/RNA helicase